MALAITAPVKQAARSGEYDPALYAQAVMGSAFPDIVGTCTTSGGQVSVNIAADEVAADVTVTVTATLLAFTTASILKYIPGAPGLYTVTVTDVTAATSTTTQIEVFGSEGV